MANNAKVCEIHPCAGKPKILVFGLESTAGPGDSHRYFRPHADGMRETGLCEEMAKWISHRQQTELGLPGTRQMSR